MLPVPFPRVIRQLPPALAGRRQMEERGAAAMKPDDFFSLAKKNQADMVDLKFVDMLGTWQHCSFPIDLWDADTFKEGLGFDGSSIRGWMGIHESDMLAMPDAGDGLHRSVFREADRQRHREHRRSGHRQGLHPRSAQRRAKGRSLPEGDGRRRHLLHRPRTRVLHLRRGPLRAEPAPGVLRDRFEPRAPGTPRASRSRTSDTSRASRAATFR